MKITSRIKKPSKPGFEGFFFLFFHFRTGFPMGVPGRSSVMTAQMTGVIRFRPKLR